MSTAIYEVGMLDLAVGLLLVLPALWFSLRWQTGTSKLGWGLGRMLLQLTLVGYFLSFIFSAQSPWPILLVLAVMVMASGWIALSEVPQQRPRLFGRALLAILIGGGLNLLVVSQYVIGIDPWFQPRYLIPLAGMIFAGAMNSLSLAAERLYSELGQGEDYQAARSRAFRAGMIPVTNGLLAVGLVSLPGMMTGQILSGVSPLVAARYQIIVMCMLVGAAGLSSAIFLMLARDSSNRVQPASDRETL